MTSYAPRSLEWILIAGLSVAMAQLYAIDLFFAEHHLHVLVRLILLAALIWFSKTVTVRLAIVSAAFALAWILAQRHTDFWCLLNCLVDLLLSVGIVYVAVLKDRLRGAQHGLQVFACQLQESVESLQLSLAQVHDIRQPATSLHLNLRQLIYSLETDDSVSPGALGNLYSAFEGSALLNERLTAAQSILQKNVLQKVPVDLAQLIDRCLKEVWPRLEAHDIELSWLNHMSTGIRVQADERSLTLAILNLLNNAIDELQGCLGQRSLAIALHSDSKAIVLAIEDSGQGFPSAMATGPMVRSSKPAGMGLGLKLVESVCRVHGVQLSYGRSCHWGGARVALSFPLMTTHRTGSCSAPVQQPLPIQNR
ncbi:sensor histidine kinase [Vulcanococcus sp.]|uniref:sensor histidine kinase n=1 Tax=Vulcanococcus sp. TaxID=2856995 RepID=UPI003C02A6C6